MDNIEKLFRLEFEAAEIDDPPEKTVLKRVSEPDWIPMSLVDLVPKVSDVTYKPSFEEVLSFALHATVFRGYYFAGNIRCWWNEAEGYRQIQVNEEDFSSGFVPLETYNNSFHLLARLWIERRQNGIDTNDQWFIDYIAKDWSWDNV